MELILSAISAGGLVGAANQYACLLIVAIAAKLNIITLSTQMSFLESYWFIGVVAFLWIITLAPAYSSLLSPGMSNVINTISNLISGFMVPLSAALLSLASIGVIVNLNPELTGILETLKLVNQSGSFAATSYAVAAAGAVSATAITGMRALTKPAISSSTGTTGTISAPLFATIENLSSVVLMVGAYVLSKIDPWLMVILFALIIVAIIALVIFAVKQLKRFSKGIGKVLNLAQVEPKAGLAIIVESFVWGIGWFAWKQWGRGMIMLFLYALWLILFLLVQPIFIGLFSFFPPITPLIGFFSAAFLVLLFISIGLATAKALMNHIEKTLNQSTVLPT